MLHITFRVVLRPSWPGERNFIRRNGSGRGYLSTSRFGHVESIRIQSNNGLSRIWFPDFGRYLPDTYQTTATLYPRRRTAAWGSWTIQRTRKDLVFQADAGWRVDCLVGWFGQFHPLIMDT
jgi:hypothetical protein